MILWSCASHFSRFLFLPVMIPDDSININNFDYFDRIFKRTNPNGCPLTGTFFVSSWELLQDRRDGQSGFLADSHGWSFLTVDSCRTSTLTTAWCR